MQVSVGDVTCRGAGRTKKLSRQDAAAKMLVALGYQIKTVEEGNGETSHSSFPVKSALKKSAKLPGEKKVTFIEPEKNPGDD